MAKQNISDLAKHVRLPEKHTKHVVEYLKHDILLSLYRKNPDRVSNEYSATVARLKSEINGYNEEIDLYTSEMESRIERLKEQGEEKNKDKINFYEDKLDTFVLDRSKQRRVAEKELQQLEERHEEVKKFNVELNAKIAEIYFTKYGKKFDPKVHSKNKRLPLFLMGPPGQGKTASYMAAAKEVCAELGLNYVEHVTDNYIPRLDDFIMVVQECAGENSAITFGGVPKAEEVTLPDGTKQSVLKKALNYRFTVFEHCAGGVLLFDDAANAASVIQNVLLPVAQNSTFQGLHIPNACIGFTGNLGALDGTYVAEQSSALLTRVIPMFVTDTVEDFLKRGYAYYNDDLGDLGYFNFLKRNPKEFADLPQSGQKSGFACSRSHDNFLQGMRSIVERNGGRGVGEAESLEEIHHLAYSCFGQELGQKIVSYYNSYIRGADPLAREFVQEGKFNAEKLKEKYKGGASSEDISFGYQFAVACGDYAVNLIAQAKEVKIDSKEFEVAIQRFGKAVLLLNNSEFSFSLEHMKNKLASYVTNFSQSVKDNRELRNDVREKIAHLINDLEDCTSDKRKALIEVITDFDKMAGANSIGVRKGTRQRMA